MDVLELEDNAQSSDSSFSGFTDEESNDKRLRSAVVVPSTSSKKASTNKSSDKVVKNSNSKSSDKHVASDKKASSSKTSARMDRKGGSKSCKSDSQSLSSIGDGIDLSKLTPENIASLRGLLGLSDTSQEQIEGDSSYGDYTANPYPMSIQVDASDISDSENPQVVAAPDFTSVLDVDSNNNAVSSDSIEWSLPKLKAPEMGVPVIDSLATLVNMASSKQCELDHILSKYKVPSNCSLVTPPSVNQEIWKVMNKSGHLNDRLMVDIQNLVATGFAAVLSLVNLLKAQGMTAEVKNVFSDLLTLLGQTQYNLSIRRRYMIRPLLKRKYASLCNMSTEITKKLFGDHIDKEIKNCETLSSLGKDFYPQRGAFFGRGRGRFLQRRGGFGNFYQPRYQPYDARQRGANAWRGSRPRLNRRAGVSSTAPNDQE